MTTCANTVQKQFPANYPTFFIRIRKALLFAPGTFQISSKKDVWDPPTNCTDEGIVWNLTFIPPDLRQHQVPRNESPSGGAGNLSMISPNPALQGQQKRWNDPMATLELTEMVECCSGIPRTKKTQWNAPLEILELTKRVNCFPDNSRTSKNGGILPWQP